MSLIVAHYLWMALTLLPVQVSDADGHAVLPLELRGAPAVVLVFVATDCPISNGYAPELQRIMAAHRTDGLRFYLVYGDATAAAVKVHEAAYGYACPALLDADHALMNRLGATVTPEVAIVGEGGRLLYRGRIDDRYVDFGRQRPAATTHDLRAALAAVVAGRPVVPASTRAVGCPI